MAQKEKPAPKPAALEEMARVAYEFHARAHSAGTEYWQWQDIPLETRKLWKALVGTVLDFRLEHRRKPKSK